MQDQRRLFQREPKLGARNETKDQMVVERSVTSGASVALLWYGDLDAPHF